MRAPNIGYATRGGGDVDVSCPHDYGTGAARGKRA